MGRRLVIAFSGLFLAVVASIAVVIHNAQRRYVRGARYE